MRIGTPKEISENERRVACTPDEAAQLIALGHEVLIERGAGVAAGFADDAYQQSGATVAESADALWREAQLICKVRAPTDAEAARLGASHILICLFHPARNRELLARIAARGATVLAMDAVPRISRAQKLDALSSMANIAGYRAVIEAAQHFGRFFTGQITAAGRIPPAKVLVIGAGVAGLSAIGAAASLGAIVRAFDTRPEVAEQIESLNAQFLRLDFDEDGSGEGGYAKTMSDEFIAAEMELFAQQAREVDIIITTALIPGKEAPKLITEEMVESMKSGSVIVDLAAEQGGNCALTQADAVVQHCGVSIIGYTDLPGRMAAQASQLYAANVRHLIAELTPNGDGEIVVDMDDPMIRGTTIAHNGEVTWPPPPMPSPPPPSPKQNAPTESSPTAQPAPRTRAWSSLIGLLACAAAILAVGAVAPASFLNHFTVFVLACFVGWQVVWNVTPALHTPLMSVTNAISSIIIIGALLQTGSADWRWLALLAVLLASINIAGGFLVTQRMLRMFRK